VTHFTATVLPDNKVSSGLAKAFGAEVLRTSFNPYGKTSERHLYGIPAEGITDLLGRLIPDPENQITINKQKPADFFREQREE